MTAQDNSKIDVVYTWVDDTFPGYAEVLSRYSEKPADSNPNRTRDNLDLLRYSLRSLRHMPELGHVHLLTCRPQVPEWLDPEAEGITVHHHDAVMDPAILPTFNSFNIVSHLHLLPGVTERFVYFEDDMVLLRPGLMQALEDPDGRHVSYFTDVLVKPKHRLTAKDSGWDHSMANGCLAMDAIYGARPRRYVIHGPKLVVKTEFAAMLGKFPDLVAATRASRFRGQDNVPPEFLYPHFAVEEGFARTATDAEWRAVEGYVSVDNIVPWTAWHVRKMMKRKPLTATFNDNFGARPNPRMVRWMRRWLEAQFPEPSPYERPSTRS